MTPERWKQIDQLVQAAMSIAPSERAAFVNEACTDDWDLRREVESLIAYQEQAASFMEIPALEAAASLADDEDQAMVGQVLAHYKVLDLLGAGGMGTVYLAHDTNLGRKVALKLLPGSVTADKDRLRRFEQEARAASALNHPNILTIYEVGRADSKHFIATEFIDGVTLRERITGARMELDEILETARQVASALAAAHDAAIVHRDIKPENIMLRRDRIVKVLDFGLAKLTENSNTREAVASEMPTKAMLQTDTGVVMGTARYMSPEQMRGVAVDARTDIWSLGCVLYEMVSGRAPFQGETNSDVIAAVLGREPVPLARYGGEAPAELEWMIRKALRKEREERYQTARELLTDLKNLKHRLAFEAELERSAPSQLKGAATTGGVQTALQTAQESPPRSRLRAEYVVSGIKNHKSTAVAMSVVLVLAIGGLGFWYFLNRSAKATQIKSIAVLPFINESGNPDVEYLSDGMTETLISGLSQIPNLSVKARNTVFRFKGKDTNTAAKELNVQAVLTGRVVQRGDELTLFLELIDAATENQLWGKQYNRKLTNLVALQTEIARDVSDSLKTKLSGADEQKLAKNYTENAGAYQLYLRGRFHWNKRDRTEMKKSVEYFQQAVTIDPNYALGYAGLADAYSILSQFYVAPPRELMPKAKEAALKAISLDDQLAEAHAALGLILAAYDWDFAGAEREFKRAIQLNPNYAIAHHYYARVLSAQGRSAEALATHRRALEIDPLSLTINWCYGITLLQSRKYEEAIAQLTKTVELDANFDPPQYWLTEVYWAKGDYAAFIEQFAKNADIIEFAKSARLGTSQLAGLARESFARGGWPGFLRAIIEDRPNMGSYLKAKYYAALGEKDKAFVELNKEVENRTSIALFVKVDPLLDSLREDPRFQELLRRVGY